MGGRPAITGPCIVVGNGPSVDEVPPDFWRMPGAAYVGTNRCLVLEAAQGVEWTAIVLRDRYSALWAVDGLGWQYHEHWWKPSAAWKVGEAHDRCVWSDEYVRQRPGWQAEIGLDKNREMAVMRNGSVVLMAVNWAYLAGARDIRLVGVDYRMPAHGRMVPPFANIGTRDVAQYQRAVRTSIEAQYAVAVAGVEAGGGRLVNCSPGTKLRAVPTKRSKPEREYDGISQGRDQENRLAWPGTDQGNAAAVLSEQREDTCPGTPGTTAATTATSSQSAMWPSDFRVGPPKFTLRIETLHGW